MRLWHYKLIPFLPKSQLLAQWRELNSIFKNQPKHILINYVYEYPKFDLLRYTSLVLDELQRRRICVYQDNCNRYFDDMEIFDRQMAGNTKSSYKFIPFEKHHDFIYLRECFYNLEEKYNRGQKDFDFQTYNNLFEFYQGEVDKHFISIL